MRRVGTDIEAILGALSHLGPLLLILAAMLLYVVMAKLRMLRPSLLTDGKYPIENLLPLAAYDSDETGYWRRRFYSAASIFGLSMFIPALLTQTLTAFSPLVTIFLFAMAGLLF